MRYVNLSNLLALRLIATKVEKRFPNYETLVRAKLLLPNEVSRNNTANRKGLSKLKVSFYWSYSSELFLFSRKND